MKPKLSKAQYELLATFRYALRRFLHFSETAAHRAGITPQHHQALLAIKGFPGRQPILVGQLADRLQIAHHSAVGLADRLVRQGYVKRRRDSADRRRVHLSLTSKGQRVLDRLSASHKAQLRQIRRPLERLLKQLAPT